MLLACKIIHALYLLVVSACCEVIAFISPVELVALPALAAWVSKIKHAVSDQ